MYWEISSQAYLLKNKFIQQTIPQKSAHIIMNTINFDEETVLDKLSHLKTTKSSGPDNIHPHILYETRFELAYPLKILYETSYKLGCLPLDWRTGNI